MLYEEEKQAWEGITPIQYHVEKHSDKCITKCPYKEKMITYKMACYMGYENLMNLSDGIIKVGSFGCHCCKFYCGKRSNGMDEEGIVMCGHDANKTLHKYDDLGLPSGMLDRPVELGVAKSNIQSNNNGE